MADERANRKMSAILSADVKGYSRLMSEDEEGTVKALNECRDIIARCVTDHRGRVVDSPGDNVLAEFVSTVEAVKCAVKIQEDIKARNAELPQSSRMEFRIGVNLGDVIEEDDRIYGDGVNIAARLEGLAEAGGICISGTAFDHVKGKLSLGYQFVGKQTVKNIPDPIRAYKVLMAPADAGKVIGEDKHRKWRWVQAAAMMLALIAGAFFISNIYFGPPPIDSASPDKMAYPLPDKPSIAVLAFDNLSGDPEQEYFSDGIAENIITALSKVGELFVIARNSSFTYKGKPVKVQQVSRELGVRYVLEGSVQKSGDSVRITAQLIDAKSGQHVWAEKYDRDLKDIFKIQDEITLKIVNGLQIQLTEGEQARIWSKQNCSLDAYLKAAEAQSIRHKGTKESFIRYGQIGQEIVEAEPECLMGYSILAWYNAAIAAYTKSPKKFIEKAFKYAQKGLSIDDSDPSILRDAGLVYLHKREYEKAIEMGQRAVDIAPNGAEFHAMLGFILSYAEMPDKCIVHANQAIRLDPFPQPWPYATLGRCYLLKGQYDKSLEAYRKALNISPDNTVALSGIIAAYSLLGREEDAHREAKRLLELMPDLNVAFLNGSPFKNQEDRNLFIDAWLKAGIPDKRQTAQQNKDN